VNEWQKHCFYTIKQCIFLGIYLKNQIQKLKLNVFFSFSLFVFSADRVYLQTETLEHNKQIEKLPDEGFWFSRLSLRRYL